MVPDEVIQLNIAINDLREGRCDIGYVHQLATVAFHGLDGDYWKVYRAPQWERVCAIYAITSAAMDAQFDAAGARARLLRVMRWEG